MELTSRTLDRIDSPITEAFALLERRTSDRPLLNLSQAAPGFSAPPKVIEAVTASVSEPGGAFYAPGMGLPDLRAAFGEELSAAYNGDVSADNVLITAGCNQAFTTVTSTIANHGDRFILPVPYYFNHDMWLRLDGMQVDHLDTGPFFVPDPSRADALITDRTRAIVLVSPGNPTGAVTPGEVIAEFAQLARRRGIMLILDETYRTFVPHGSAPHGLFSEPDWADTVVSLHSFSKEFAIPGYRVGALVAHPRLLAESLKLLDCIAICAPRPGQVGALAGLLHERAWRSEQVARIRGLQAEFEAVFSTTPGGWELRAAGAYFGWVRHPWDCTTGEAVERLLFEHDVLAIPGTGFTPEDTGMVRMSFANLTSAEIAELERRLATDSDPRS